MGCCSKGNSDTEEGAQRGIHLSGLKRKNIMLYKYSYYSGLNKNRHTPA